MICTWLFSLFDDHWCFVIPNSLQCTLNGHTKNVKTVTFVGTDPTLFVSGSSDNTIRVCSFNNSYEGVNSDTNEKDKKLQRWQSQFEINWIKFTDFIFDRSSGFLSMQSKHPVCVKVLSNHTSRILGAENFGKKSLN